MAGTAAAHQSQRHGNGGGGSAGMPPLVSSPPETQERPEGDSRAFMRKNLSLPCSSDRFNYKCFFGGLK